MDSTETNYVELDCITFDEMYESIFEIMEKLTTLFTFNQDEIMASAVVRKAMGAHAEHVDFDCDSMRIINAGSDSVLVVVLPTVAILALDGRQCPAFNIFISLRESTLDTAIPAIVVERCEPISA